MIADFSNTFVYMIISSQIIVSNMASAYTVFGVPGNNNRIILSICTLVVWVGSKNMSLELWMVPALVNHVCMDMERWVLMCHFEIRVGLDICMIPAHCYK